MPPCERAPVPREEWAAFRCRTGGFTSINPAPHTRLPPPFGPLLPSSPAGRLASRLEAVDHVTRRVPGLNDLWVPWTVREWLGLAGSPGLDAPGARPDGPGYARMVRPGQDRGAQRSPGQRGMAAYLVPRCPGGGGRWCGARRISAGKRPGVGRGPPARGGDGLPWPAVEWLMQLRPHRAARVGP